MAKQFSEINFRDLGLVEYRKFLEIQRALTPLKQNIVLFATHYPVYTVGKNETEKFPFAVPVNRGGSITYFDEGTLMVYFIFNVKNPAVFFKNVRKTLNMFFDEFALPIYYDKKKPGYYIMDRKIASLGFSYVNGRSNHGVSIHIKPDLEKFNKISPCNLKNIKATSLEKEGVIIDINKSKTLLKEIIKEVFNEA